MTGKTKGLYKFEFYRYYRAALTGAPVSRSAQTSFVITLFFFACFVMLYTAITSSCPVADTMAFLSLLVFASSLAMGEYLKMKPSLASLMPIPDKKKLLYRFTSSLLLFLRILFYVLIGMALAFAIIVVIALLINVGNNQTPDVSADTDGSWTIGVNTGLYGGIFAAAFFVICFSAGVIAGYFKKSRHRNLFLAAFVCAVVLAFVLTGLPNLIITKQLYPNSRPLIDSPYSEWCYKNFPAAWVLPLLWCVAAAGCLFAAIYTGYKKIKQTQY